MTSTEVQRHTPEDLLRMSDHRLFELVDGELREKEMGWEASLIATILVRLIDRYDPDFQQGQVVVEGTYQCFPDDPNKVRRPDVSFVRKEKFAGRDYPRAHSPIVPDLIVEIVSPNDTYVQLERRIEEHLRAGVSLAWVINPETRTVAVYRAGQADSRRLHEDDELDGENVLPGFRCHVRDIFAPLDVK